MITLPVPREADGIRLDLFLLRYGGGDLTRGALQRVIRDGRIQITGKRVVKPSTIVHAGQEITADLSPTAAHRGTRPASALPPLVILHEDQGLIVLDKPAGVSVHAGVKAEPSLADALIARFPALAGVGETVERPGIVHRLDKDTSGVLLVARTAEMYEHLKHQFQNRQVRKEYVALVHGRMPENEGAVKLPITRSRRNPLRRTVVLPRKGEPTDATWGKGKDAETYFRVMERFHEHTLLAVFPRTGRMHQIRVHLAHLGFPVAGDALYGRKSHYRTPPGLHRQFLHAQVLTVTLPSGKQRTFESPLPDDLSTVLEALRRDIAEPSEKSLTYRWRGPRAMPKTVDSPPVTW